MSASHLLEGSARQLLIWLCSSFMLQGCATRSLWDNTRPDAFAPVRHVGKSLIDEEKIVVGYCANDAAHEQWFVIQPGGSGPPSFWVKLADQVQPLGKEVLISTTLNNQLQKTRAVRVAAPPDDTLWLKVRLIQTAKQTESGITGFRAQTYAFQIDAVTKTREAAAIDLRWGMAAPEQGEALLVIPRAPKGAQTGEVLLAVVLTPVTGVIDVLTFPISIPLAAWRPADGP